VLGVNPQVYLPGRRHSTATLIIKQVLIIRNLGHHLDVHEAMNLIARPSTAPTPQNMDLIWEFLKGNTHRIKRELRSGTWVARLARLQPKPINPSALPTKLVKFVVSIWGKWTGTLSNNQATIKSLQRVIYFEEYQV
jgi:hypothetical protein